MPYSPLPSKTSTSTLTLGDYDTIRDHFAAGVPDIFAAKGDLAAGTGADGAARLAAGADDATLVPDASQSTGLAWQIQPAARVYHNASQDPTPGGWVTLAFNSERFDTDGSHSTVTNTSRLTVPAGGAGLYLIGAQAEFDLSAIGVGALFGLRLLVNGLTVIAVAWGGGNGADGFDVPLALYTLSPRSSSL